MNATMVSSSLELANAWRPILWGGLIAGVLDITAAFIQAGLRGATPVRVLHAVASGLLGRESYSGGLKTAALGLFCHFIIATGATAVYWLASRWLPWLTTQAVLCGMLYGVAVYFFMNLVVLPLSAFPGKITFPLRALIPGLLIHIFCVGLPIALVVRWQSK
jgi:hypothetical protein